MTNQHRATLSTRVVSLAIVGIAYQLSACEAEPLAGAKSRESRHTLNAAPEEPTLEQRRPAAEQPRSPYDALLSRGSTLAQAVVAEVTSRLDRDVGFSFNDRGDLRYIAHKNLGGLCPSLAPPEPAAVAHCLMAELAPAYPLRYLEAREWNQKATVDTGWDDSTRVTLEQYVDGVVVANSGVNVMFHEGKVRSILGTPIDPRLYAGRTRTIGAVDLERASIAAGASLTLLEDGHPRFDTERRRFLVDAISMQDDRTMTYVLDSDTSEIVSIEDRVVASNATRTVKTWNYNGSLATPDASGRTSKSTTYDVTASGGDEIHDLDRSGFGYVSEARYSSAITSYGATCNENVCSSTAYATITAPSGQQPWDAISNTDYRRYVSNAFYWTNQIADYVGHWSAGFGGTKANLPLKLKVSVCQPRGPGEYNASTNTLLLGAEGQSPCNSVAATDLDTIAHEYGHYLHHRYGNTGTRAVMEAFASLMPLRWVKYANEFRGEFPGLTFAFAPIHDTYEYDGESNHVDGQRIVGQSIWCSPNEDTGLPAQNPYDCGAGITTMFWELVWDTCRMTFAAGGSGCTVGGDIIQSNPYNASANRVANYAFAKAVYSISSSANKTTDYMLAVEDVYREVRDRSTNTISGSDFVRVQMVLAHHCAGSAETCGTTHSLPYHVLPSALTAKSPTRYREAEVATRSGGTSIFADANSSQGQVLWFNSTPSTATLSFSVPASGVYFAKFVGRRLGGTNGVVEAQFSVGSAQQVTISTSSWDWYEIPIFVDTAITQTLTLRRISGSFDIDAVVLEQ